MRTVLASCRRPDFLDADEFEAGRGFGPIALRRNVTESAVPSNTGVADGGAGRDELRGRESATMRSSPKRRATRVRCTARNRGSSSAAIVLSRS